MNIEAERQAFERVHCGGNKHLTRRDSTTGNYVLPSIHDAWSGWLSRAAQDATRIAELEGKLAAAGKLRYDYAELLAYLKSRNLLETVAIYERKLAAFDKELEAMIAAAPTTAAPACEGKEELTDILRILDAAPNLPLDSCTPEELQEWTTAIKSVLVHIGVATEDTRTAGESDGTSDERMEKS